MSFRAVQRVSEPPDELRAAQDAMRQAAAAEAAAAVLVMEAGERVATAKAARVRYDGLASKAVRLIADRLKARDRTPLPDDLAEARRAGLDAAEAVAQTEAVAAILRDEHQVAARDAEAARDRLATAVDAKMQAAARELIARMRATEAEAGRLRGLAVGLSQARPITAPAVDWDIGQIVHEPQHPHLLAGAGPGWKDVTAAWHHYRDALLTDADAVGPQ